MLWLVPSIVALLIKFVLFFYSNVHREKYFFIFLVFTVLLNISELLVVLHPSNDFWILKFYYCSIIFTFFYLLVFCADVTNSLQWLKSRLLLIVIATFAAIVVLTDYILAGFAVLPNNALTRISGDYYAVFQFYTVGALLFSLLLLLSKAFMVKDDIHLRNKCIIALIAFAPFSVPTLLVVLLMYLGYAVNMVALSSLCLSFMLLVFISLSNKHKLFLGDQYKFFLTMKFLPFSRARRYHLEKRRLVRALDSPIAGQSVDLRGLLKKIEALVISHAKDQYQTQKEVASKLNISESSLSRRVEKSKKSQ